MFEYSTRLGWDGDIESERLNVVSTAMTKAKQRHTEIRTWFCFG